MRKLSLFLLLTSFPWMIFAQISPEQQDEIDALFAPWNSIHSPGAALGVIQNGKLVYAKGYGMADLEHDVPITSSSVFYAASVSKHFVTMCILLLEEQGKLDLDAEIQEYLPDFPRYEAPLTIRNFMLHTSGVRDNLTLWSLAGNDYYDHIEKEAIYDLIKQQKSLNFPPGERYLYSNSCYFMLAMIIEKVSGLSIKEFAQKHMFGPLGMKNTRFHDDVYQLINKRAFSYEPGENGYRNLIMRYDLVGSGGLYTCIEDLFLWDQNFYDNQLGKGGQAIIEKIQTDGFLNNGESAGYALGLVNSTHRGQKTVGHSGALAGYRTNYVRFPDQNFSVFVLANISTFRSPEMALKVADIMLADVLDPIPEPTEEQQTARGDGNQDTSESLEPLTAEQLEAYAGTYFSEELQVRYHVFAEEGGLRCRIRYQTMDMEYVGVDTWNMAGAYLTFSQEKKNRKSFTIDAGRVQGIVFVREK